jgi:ornithine cyclodeaminase/alanine dehydrogenase-like protein (mu-crystallin family)
MALLINNDITARVLTMDAAVEAMERVLRQYALGLATFQPRTDIWAPTAVGGDYFRWGSLLGAMYDPPTLALRFKSDIITWTEYEGAVTEEWHNMEPGKYCGFIILIDMRNGEIIGLMNDGVLHHVRVGATAGVGAKYLSRTDSAVLGVVGSGGMAETYAEAICHVRRIEEIRVYSPTPAHREAYAEKMSKKLGVPVLIKENNLGVARDADIVALCTDSRTPVYTLDMLKAQKPGATFIRCRLDEVDEPVLGTVDKIFGNQQEPYTEFVIGSQQERDRRPSNKEYRRRYKPRNYPLLAQVIAGEVQGRQSETETIYFDNNSAGLQFAAVGRVVYDRAKQLGLGMEIPMAWFQQDIRN